MTKTQLWKSAGYALCLVMITIVNTAALASPAGGKITVSFTQTVSNACGGDVDITATGKATILVVAGSNGQGAIVSVSYAPVVFIDGNSHNTYVETGAALGAFTAQAAPDFTYTIPLVLKFKGQNGAPSFSVVTDEKVTVDQNQAPTHLDAPGTAGRCDSD